MTPLQLSQNVPRQLQLTRCAVTGLFKTILLKQWQKTKLSQLRTVLDFAVWESSKRDRKRAEVIKVLGRVASDNECASVTRHHRHNFYMSFKKNVMPSTWHSTWLYRSGGLSTSLALRNDWCTPHGACMKMPKVKCLLVVWKWGSPRLLSDPRLYVTVLEALSQELHTCCPWKNHQSQYPAMYSSLCNSLEDLACIDFIFIYMTFKGVAVVCLKYRTEG